MRKYYSTNKLDQYLNELVFEKQHDGFFLDIGAYDGILNSKTCFFEKSMDWKGLCIEAIPEHFKLLVQNRNSKNLLSCISSEEEEQLFWNNGINSGLKDYYNNELLPNNLYQINDDILLKKKCETLNTVLQSALITEIDLCCIDVCGSEILVLDGLDLNSTDISVFCIHNSWNHNHSDYLAYYMQMRGYQLINKIAGEEVYVKNAG